MRNSKISTGFLLMNMFVAIMILAGCAETRTTSRPIEQLCQMDEMRQCKCSDGSDGISYCLSEYDGFGECVCDGGDTPVSTDTDTVIGTDTGTETTVGPDTDTETGTTNDTGSGSVIDTETSTETGSDIDTEDTQVDPPEVGVECDENNPCEDGLECFAGHCMDNVGSLQWGDAFEDEVNAIAIDDDDNIYVAGSRREANLGTVDPNQPRKQKVFLSKFDHDGVPLWSKEFGGASTSNIVNDMVLDGLDNIYIVGESRENLDGQIVADGFHSYMYITKYDSSGERIWVTQSTMEQWAGVPKSNRARGVAIDSGGDPWVVGTIVNNKMFFMKFSQDGGEAGNITGFCDDGTYSSGNDIIVDHDDGSIYILGSDDNNAVLFKYDADGLFEWSEDWKTTNDMSDSPQRMVMGTDDFIYVVGHSEVESSGNCGDSGCTDIFVTKIDKSISSVKWTTHLEQFATADYGKDITVNPNGGVYITGTMFSDIALVPFGVEHEWHLIASYQNQDGLEVIMGESFGGPPDESGLPIGSARDYFYDSTDAPSVGVEHGLYNKVGAEWKLVASPTGLAGMAKLHIGTGAPSSSIGVATD